MYTYGPTKLKYLTKSSWQKSKAEHIKAKQVSKQQANKPNQRIARKESKQIRLGANFSFKADYDPLRILIMMRMRRTMMAQKVA